VKLRVDPLVLSVALGLLNPSVFEVEHDPAGESQPPPMLERVLTPGELPSPQAEEPTEG